MRNCHMDADTFNRRHPTRQITGGNLTENTEKKIDLNDGDPWSEAHVSDLWASLEYGDFNRGSRAISLPLWHDRRRAAQGGRIGLEVRQQAIAATCTNPQDH